MKILGISAYYHDAAAALVIDGEIAAAAQEERFMSQKFDVVTGATSYTGKYITRKLLASGRLVKSLTNHPNRVNEFGDRVEAIPFNFDNPSELTKNLKGVEVLYNTYWVRFPHQGVTFDSAVQNTKILMRAL